MNTTPHTATPAPWAAVVAQLATRRAPVERNVDTSPEARRRRGMQAEVAARRSQATRARILAALAAGAAAGMTADAISLALGGAKASGNLYRHLNAMAAAGTVEKIKINKQDVQWRKT